jgi:hypothetical protein
MQGENAAVRRTQWPSSIRPEQEELHAIALQSPARGHSPPRQMSDTYILETHSEHNRHLIPTHDEQAPNPLG